MGARDTERHQRRADALRRYADRYATASEALQRVYDENERLRTQYAIRRCLVLSRPGAIGTHDERRPSPIAGLLTQKGWALQLYLVALFDAQSRRRRGAVINNVRPLRSDARQMGWVDFLPATTTTVDRGSGMMRQLTRALTLLAKNDLVHLRGRAGVAGRFEKFQLLDESGIAHGWSFNRYEIPASDGVMGQDFRPPASKAGVAETLQVPASFFLQGWVHVLSAAEIATYLMLREMETRYPERSKSGVFVNEPTRKAWYSLNRDVYESHQQLAQYGVIERLETANRGLDGKIRRQPTGTTFLEALRFRTLQGGFDRPALKTVTAALS